MMGGIHNHGGYEGLGAHVGRAPASPLSDFFPTGSVHNAAMVYGVGLDPLDVALLDTRKITGLGIALTPNVGPLVKLFLSRL